MMKPKSNNISWEQTTKENLNNIIEDNTEDYICIFGAEHLSPCLLEMLGLKK